MRSPFFGLLYFMWLRSRFALKLMAGLCAGTAATIRMGMGLAAYSDIADLGPALSLAIDGFVIVALGSMMFSLIDAEELQASHRTYRYLAAMPVRTRRLSAGFMLYTLLVVGIVSWVTAAAHARFVNQGYFVDDVLFLKFPLICVSAAAWAQSMWFFVGVTNEILIGVCGFCVWGMGLGAIVLFVSEKYAPLGLALCLALIPVAYSVSCAGLSAFRRGGGQSVIPWISERFSQAVFRTTPFATPESALLWYTWRRHFRPILLGVACVGVPVLLVAFFVFRYVPRLSMQSATWHACTFLVAGGALWATLASLARDVYELDRGASYLVVQPVRSMQIARGFLLPMAGTLLLVFAMGTPCVFVASHYLSVAHGWATVPALQSCAVVGACMAAAWIMVCYNLGVLLLIGFTSMGIALCRLWLGVPGLSAFEWILVALLLIGGAGSLVYGWRTRYLERRSVVAMLIAWGLGLLAAQVVAMLLHADPRVFLPPSSVRVIPNLGGPAAAPVIPGAAFALLYAATLLVPLPFIHLPAFIAHYRHR